MKLTKGSFFGTTRKSIEDSHFLLTETYHPADSMLPFHSHDSPYFSLVLSGLIEEESRYARYQRKPGTLVYHPHGYGHHDSFQKGHSEVFNIELSGGLLEHMENSRAGNRFQFIFDETTVSLARRIYVMFLEGRQQKQIYSEVSRLIEQSACGNGIGEIFQFPQWFDRILFYIDLHYADSIHLDTLAELAGYHPVHISRSFRKYLNCTMSEYVNKVRIEKACFQLRSKNVPLSTLAYQLGYADHSHFTKTFVQLVGIPPIRYRRLFQGSC